MASEFFAKAAAGLFALAILAGFTAPPIAQSTRHQNGEIMLGARWTEDRRFGVHFKYVTRADSL